MAVGEVDDAQTEAEGGRTCRERSDRGNDGADGNRRDR